jgi:hypothetical protein
MFWKSARVLEWKCDGLKKTNRRGAVNCCLLAFYLVEYSTRTEPAWLDIFCPCRFHLMLEDGGSGYLGVKVLMGLTRNAGGPSILRSICTWDSWLWREGGRGNFLHGRVFCWLKRAAG